MSHFPLFHRCLSQRRVTGPTPQSGLRAEPGAQTGTLCICLAALRGVAWDISVSSPRLPNPSCRHLVLDDECFYTSHPTRKQNLFESCVTGFSRISSFQNPPVSLAPSNYHLNFPICSSLCTMQSLGQRDLPPGFCCLGLGQGRWSPS